jgi:hypothetical protein
MGNLIRFAVRSALLTLATNFVLKKLGNRPTVPSSRR